MRKRFIFLMILAVSAGVLSGCAAAADKKDISLSDVVDGVCEGVETPATEIITLNKDNFEFYAFTDYRDGLEAVAADALVNITPHSLVVIKTDSGDGEALAEDIIMNADPNKWLCVGAEVVNVAYNDDYVLLVMSDEDTADAIADNFVAMAEGLGGGKGNILSWDNARFEGTGKSNDFEYYNSKSVYWDMVGGMPGAEISGGRLAVSGGVGAARVAGVSHD